MINESGTMTGGGGRARGGRICVGSAAPQSLDTQEAAAELARAEAEFDTSKQVGCTDPSPEASSRHAQHCNLAAYAAYHTDALKKAD